MTKNFNLESLDKDYLFHPVTNLKSHLSDDMLILEKGEGIYVFDKEIFILPNNQLHRHFIQRRFKKRSLEFRWIRPYYWQPIK